MQRGTRTDPDEARPEDEAADSGCPEALTPRGWSTLLQVDWRAAGAAGVLIVADWLTVLACLGAVWSMRSAIAPRFFPGLEPVLPLGDFVLQLYGLAPWTLAFAQAKLYTRRALFWNEARQTLYACTAASLFAVALSFAGRSAESLSRVILAVLWAITIVAVPIARYHVKRLLAAAGLWRKRVLIAGAGESGVQVCERIRANPDLGYEPVGFVDDDAAKAGRKLCGLAVYGPLRDMPRLVDALGAKDVVLAMPHLPRERLLHLVAICEGHVQSIRLVPDLFGLASVGVDAEDLDGVLLLHMRWNLAKPWNLLWKRAFDLVAGSVAAVLLAPLLLLAALLIRIDSGGPALFVQERLGRNRRPFRCVKFRTMHADNDERLRHHLSASKASRAEWERFAKLKSADPRVTRVGRLLRRSSIDELPQLWNVLRGEMSLVGPRPYLPAETERMGDFAETISKAPPGITGLWQASGRNRLSFEQRLRLDEYYVRNWSLWLDVIVLIKTAGVVLRGRGAY